MRWSLAVLRLGRSVTHLKDTERLTRNCLTYRLTHKCETDRLTLKCVTDRQTSICETKRQRAVCSYIREVSFIWVVFARTHISIGEANF